MSPWKSTPPPASWGMSMSNAWPPSPMRAKANCRIRMVPPAAAQAIKTLVVTSPERAVEQSDLAGGGVYVLLTRAVKSLKMSPRFSA